MFFIAFFSGTAYLFFSFRIEGELRRMIICSCRVLSDKQVRNALAAPSPPRTPCQVHRHLGSEPECGHCVRSMREIIEKARLETPAATLGAKVA
jgi:bacterioferritin-associated ferredoxin